MNPPPIDADATEILTHTVAYWEHGAGSSQSELIPVYVLTVKYSLQGTPIVTDDAYIPASPLYMRPFARIESYPMEKVKIGQTVTFTATDASTPLDQLGYPDNLDFTLGTGFSDSYLYDWYLGSVDDANKIGTGRSFDYTVVSDMDERSGNPTQTIILVVTEQDNPDQPSTMTSVTLDLFSYLYLPFVTDK